MSQRGTSGIFVTAIIVVAIAVYLAFSISQTNPLNQFFTSGTTATLETPTVNSGEVAITTSKDTYQVGGDVEVTIKNNTREPIASLNFKFNCSMVKLEYKTDGWKPIEDRCFSKMPTRSVVIKPGEEHTVLLPTKDLELGAYRVRLDYVPGENAFVKRMFLIVYSEEFQITTP